MRTLSWLRKLSTHHTRAPFRSRQTTDSLVLHLFVLVSIAAMVGIVAGLLCYESREYMQQNEGDLGWSVQAARDLLAGRNPYARPLGPQSVTYPLTAAVAMIPLTPWSAATLGSLFIGISVALFAYGALRSAYPWRVLALFSFSALNCIMFVQWSLLVAALLLLPLLLPLAMCKPNIGVPALLTALINHHARLWIVAGCALFGLLTLLIHPTWPLEWLGLVGEYIGQPMLFSMPVGPLLLLVLLRWRTWRGQLLLFVALFPVRGFYDVMLLYLIPRSIFGVLVLVVNSWLLLFTEMYVEQHPSVMAWLLALPCLVMVLSQPPAR